MTTPIPPRKLVRYTELTNKPNAQEQYNIHKVSAVLADFGLQVITIQDDSNGPDFIIKDQDHNLYPVQLKSRITISKKYLKSNKLLICFPQNLGKFTDHKHWYIIPHDDLITLIGNNTKNALNTKSWINNGEWSAKSLSKKIHQALTPYLYSLQED